MNLNDKIKYTKSLIKCWVDSWGADNVHVTFSGGIDSTVLLHIVRSMYPGVKGVFSNTGLEFPEIVSFVKTFDNIDILKPKMPFHKVIEKYGWPVVSKNVSMAISRYRNTTKPEMKHFRLHGRVVNGKKHTRGVIPKKWQYLIDAPFKISDECCNYLKLRPFSQYEKLTNSKPMNGSMMAESNKRMLDVTKRGCNVYDAKHPVSRPLAHWTKEDIQFYIWAYELRICSVYQQGYPRTGCVFCMYGLHQEQKNTGSNRFQKMKITHPKLYNYCINKLGAGEVLDFMGAPY